MMWKRSLQKRDRPSESHELIEALKLLQNRLREMLETDVRDGRNYVDYSQCTQVAEQI